jgi:hypothetical protein
MDSFRVPGIPVTAEIVSVDFAAEPNVIQMKIEINEKAVRHFNEKAQEFLYELKPDKTQRQKIKRVESSAAHAFVTKHLSEKDVIEFASMGYVDNLTGRQVARYFNADNIPIGLDEKSYAEFDKFIENIYRRREINSLLSQSFLYECAFKWFEKKYKGTLSAEKDLITFLREEGEESIKKFKVSLPISFLSIEKPFKFGRVSFDYLKKAFCDRYINDAKSKANEQDQFDENTFNIFESRFRKRYQGTVIASITIEAEQQRCMEIGKLQIEKALTVLRFFSPSAFLPEIPCYFGIMGQTDIPKSYYFVFGNEDELPLIQEGIDEMRMHSWSISAHEYSRLYKMGLGLGSSLIIKEHPTQFEDSVLNSMFLFGRALTSREFQDKVVYALVSIETLLLQNQSEPIQSNVGLRLAFLSESEPEKRKHVKETINRAYKFRSSYIHHGKIGEEDWELLKVLQHIIWTAIRNALISLNRFRTQREFIDYIEKMILS